MGKEKKNFFFFVNINDVVYGIDKIQKKNLSVTLINVF